MEQLNRFWNEIGPILAQLTPEEQRKIREAFEHVRAGASNLEVRVGSAMKERADAESQFRKTTEELDRKYRTTFEHSGTAMAIVEKDGIISHANSFFLKLSGYSRGEVENKRSFTDFIEESSRTKLLDYHHRRRAGDPDVPSSYEARAVTREGKVLDIIVMMEMFPGSSESIASIIDITDRKRAEEELKLFKASVDGASDEVFWLDFEGTIMYVNDAASRLTGYSRQELLAMKIFALDPYFDPARWEEFTSNLRKKGDLFFSTRHLRKNGEIRDVEIIANYIKRDDTEYSFAFVRDITERKKTEDAIKEQERFLNDVLSAIRDGISVQDPSMKVMRTNKTMEQWHHQSVPLVGKRCYEAYHQRHKPCVSCPVQKTLKTGKPDRAVLTIKEGDMTMGWAEVFSYPLFSPATGEITGVIEYVCDITEQKNLEFTYEREMDYYTAELKRYAETLATTNNKLNLLNNVTRHDILNTVTGLLGSVDMALASGTKEEQTALLNDIRSLGQTVQRQIEFTRQYQDIGVKAAEWYEVQSTIRSAAEQLPLEGISLAVSVDRLAIYADPLIGKVFYNLMENSLRHGEHVTRMAFDLRKSGSDMVITFSDDGAGIPDDQKEKVFLQGFGKHTGLGMYLARAILSITGITIKETGECGKGARFEMVVPEGAYRETGIS